MTRTELLDAATEMLVAASKLLDRADEDTLADDALELAERVNLRIALNSFEIVVDDNSSSPLRPTPGQSALNPKAGPASRLALPGSE